jgi:hypothetical protein
VLNSPGNKVLPTADIIPYSRNSRTHSVSQINAIAASIRQFGFTNPLLVDEMNVLIAGHGRLAAAQQLGIAELPAIVLAGLSDTQKQALRIADNKLALNAGWDSPAYCDVAILRWQAFTGQTATRPDGTPFGAISGQPAAIPADA